MESETVSFSHIRETGARQVKLHYILDSVSWDQLKINSAYNSTENRISVYLFQKVERLQKMYLYNHHPNSNLATSLDLVLTDGQINDFENRLKWNFQNQVSKLFL